MKILTATKTANTDIFFIVLTQFGMAFSYNFVMVFMPFYILKISPFGQQETLLWIGFIIGGPSIVTALFSTFWGSLTARFSPKLLFERSLFCSAVIILLIGYVQNLYLLLVLRLLQGVLGGASTIGLILTSSLSPKENLSGNISLFQNAITTGQLVGPPAGAYAASMLGYHYPFLISSLMLIAFLIFCHIYVPHVPPKADPPRETAPVKMEVLAGLSLGFIATVQLIFLPSILPRILADFGMIEKEALNAAGIIMMAYTGSAIAGSYLLCNLTRSLGLRKILTVAALAAAVFQVLLIGAQGFRSLTALRMIQTAFIAAVFPLTVALFARGAGGKTIGLLNGARFLGNAAGPLMATSILAYTNLLTLYTVLAALTLGALWAFLALVKTGDEPCSAQDS